MTANNEALSNCVQLARGPCTLKTLLYVGCHSDQLPVAGHVKLGYASQR